MATIPPHYSDRFILQRYNKALHFVQHLPASSNFQPTKNQKLELYALYKQVSEGNIKTQRPGLFDVVGRAKWDAWKKLEGLSQMEARHLYVEALLKVAKEAYMKNMGRDEAQQIIHAFAIMRPSGEETDDDLIETDTTSNLEDNEDDDTSIESEDAEEQAYLRDIQKSNIESSTTATERDPPAKSSTTPLNHDQPERLPNRLRQPALTRAQLQQHQIEQEILHQQQQQRQQQQQNRPPSVASIQTMVTAPTTPQHLPLGSRSTSRVGQHISSLRVNDSRQPVPSRFSKDDMRILPSISNDSNNGPYNETDFIDDSINPWQSLPSNLHKPPNRQAPDANSGVSSDDNFEHHNTKFGSSARTRRSNSGGNGPQLRLPSPMYQQQKQQFQQRLQHQSVSSMSPPFIPSQHSPQTQALTGMTPILRSSPVPGSSTSSSVTATPQNHLLHQHHYERPVDSSIMPTGKTRTLLMNVNDNQHLPRLPQSQINQNSSSSVTTVALGPATKRALESLQNEVVALNNRIDDLRKELVERDKLRPSRKQTNSSNGDSGTLDDIGDNWRWVIKAALKYAGVNIMTALILFFVLYKSDSPIAFAILRQANKYWRSFKLRVLISNVVV